MVRHRFLLASLGLPILGPIVSEWGTSAAELANNVEPALLEPKVRREVGVLPKSVCRELIELGEEAGFLVQYESIDEDEQEEAKTNPNKTYVPSQSLEVYNRRRGIGNEAIWKLLQPWLPRMSDLVIENRNPEMHKKYYPDDPNRPPKLDWVFFRKYSPESERNALALHVDSNVHTINVAVNDDYEGGGMFYVKPPADQPEETDDDRPVLPKKLRKKYEKYEHTGLGGLRKQNTTDLVFPHLNAGDLIVYNFTVWHAVAPIESGTRYSFVLFYDMDNPAIREDDEDEDDEEEVLAEFTIAIQNKLPEHAIDIVWVMDPEEGDNIVLRDEIWKETKVVAENIAPSRGTSLTASVGDLFLAVVSGTNHVVTKILIEKDQSRFIKITEEEFIEPVVKREQGVVPASVCQQLIEAGESTGFLDDYESIDNGFDDPATAQSIDVFDRRKNGKVLIENEAVWKIIEPWVPTLTEYVWKDRPTNSTRPPRLDWVFFRKFSPESDRNSLILHTDVNMHTLNLAVNDDYKGGGIFYIKPPADQPEGIVVPKISNNLRNYDWNDKVKRRNSTNIVFPQMNTGDIITYNYTLWHAVAPVESGIRYSLIFFYDMDNPLVRDDNDDEDEDEEDDEVPSEFNVVFHNKLPESSIDIVWVANTTESHDVLLRNDEWRTEMTVGKNIPPSRGYTLKASVGYVFLAVVSGTHQLVDEFEIKKKQSRYIKVTEREFLEPELRREVGVVPPSVCKKLIERGEQSGFFGGYESIDEGLENAASSQHIDVFDRRKNGTIIIGDEGVWNVLEPWIPALTEHVAKDRSTKTKKAPQLDWVFFRKFSPDSDRNSLSLHTDVNMHTLNIALNDDYEGGGIFYIKPLANQPDDAVVPEISKTYRNYKWNDKVKRLNSTDVVFPHMNTGDIIVYNYTLWHAVAPVESGTRYSLVLFFDMDNPALNDDFEFTIPDDDDYDEIYDANDIQEEEDDYDENYDANDIQEEEDDTVEDNQFDVEFYNTVSEAMDIVWDMGTSNNNSSATGNGQWRNMTVFRNINPFDGTKLAVVEGEVFWAVKSGTNEVVTDIHIKSDQLRYVISRRDNSMGEL